MQNHIEKMNPEVTYSMVLFTQTQKLHFESHENIVLD